VARLGEKANAYGASVKERDHLQDLDIDGRIFIMDLK